MRENRSPVNSGIPGPSVTGKWGKKKPFLTHEVAFLSPQKRWSDKHFPRCLQDHTSKSLGEFRDLQGGDNPEVPGPWEQGWLITARPPQYSHPPQHFVHPLSCHRTIIVYFIFLSSTRPGPQKVKTIFVHLCILTV